MAFIDLSSLGLATTTTELLDEWLAFMQATYPGYQPDTLGNGGPMPLEYVQAQSLAALLSDVSQTGVVVPDAIVRAFGTKLFGVPYLTGTNAQAVVQITAVDTQGHTLPAGTDIDLAGGTVGFTTTQDLTVPAGQSTGQVIVTATQVGTASNGAGSPAELVSLVDWVSSATVVTPSSGGVDPESDTDYQTRLSATLQLQAPRPITAQDFATMALSFAPAAGTDQQEIGRATAIDGYQDANATFTLSLTSGSTTATITTPPATGVYPAQGASITGTDIPAGTIVNSATTSTVTLSNPASATASVTATVSGTLGNERTVTTIAARADGTAPNNDTLTAAQTWLAGYREANFNVAVVAPTYTNVYVTVSCHLYPGFSSTATASTIQQAIINFLSPATFGEAAFGDSNQWFSGCTIYYSQLMSVIQSAAGGAVQNIVDGSLKLGTAASPTGTADLVLPGPVGLPESSTSTVTVTIA